jgi:magnesium transporter
VSIEQRIAELFAGSHPAEAARALEALSEDELRNLLDSCELSVTAGVVGAMAPQVASRYLARTTNARAAEILATVPFECGADLLRRLSADERARVLSPVASERRRHLEKLLRYPELTAGALMEPRVGSFHPEQTVAEIVGDAHRRGGDIHHYLYVTDEDHSLRGVLSLRELVVAPRDASLGSIMVSPVEHLLARAHQSAILAHPGWRRFPLLPVVGDSGRLVGVFRYETLRTLERHPADAHESSPLGVTLALGELFWFGASGLIQGWEGSEDE